MIKNLIQQAICSLLAQKPGLQQKIYYDIIKRVIFQSRDSNNQILEVCDANCADGVLASCIRKVIPDCNIALISPAPAISRSLSLLDDFKTNTHFYTAPWWKAFEVLKYYPEYLIIDLSYDFFLTVKAYNELSDANASPLDGWCCDKTRSVREALNHFSKNDLQTTLSMNGTLKDIDKLVDLVIRARAKYSIETDYDFKKAMDMEEVPPESTFNALHALRIWSSDEIKQVSSLIYSLRDTPELKTYVFFVLSNELEKKNVSRLSRWNNISKSNINIDSIHYNPHIMFNNESDMFSSKMFRISNKTQAKYSKE